MKMDHTGIKVGFDLIFNLLWKFLAVENAWKWPVSNGGSYLQWILLTAQATYLQPVSRYSFGCVISLDKYDSVFQGKKT